ncbi:MAG: hypothetical protein PHV18_01285 [Lachnospiraceae bacterium]|nr:hypothetical protein [Lachnospiraceae bacterium]
MMLPVESVYESEEDGALREQRRDVSKYVRNLDAVVALIGMENQTREDSDMGIRMLGYDYSYHLIDVPRLIKDQRSKLTSDFKVVADFFAEKDQEAYRPSKQEIVHVKAVLRMLRAFTGDKRYQDIGEEIMESVERGEVITVCDFADRMEKQGVKQGVDEALQLAVKLAELGRTDEIS